VTVTLDQARADLEQWLPVAAALIATPDTAPGPGTRTAPGSKPPWNAEKANLVHGIVAGLVDWEAEFRQQVTGTVRARPAYRQTGTVLRSIASMATAVLEQDADDARRWMEAQVTAIMQLPAVDVEERPRKVRSACPFCGLGMLRLLPRSGRVTCLRYGACRDGDGAHPTGELAISHLDGEPRIYWSDGSVT
jgi:hypothetical protein